MEYLGTGLPTLGVGENSTIVIAIQIVIFLILIFVVIQILKLYFKTIELKKDPEKNQAEIEKNLKTIEKFKKNFIKIGGVVFAIIFIATVILINL